MARSNGPVSNPSIYYLLFNGEIRMYCNSKRRLCTDVRCTSFLNMINTAAQQRSKEYTGLGFRVRASAPELSQLFT